MPYAVTSAAETLAVSPRALETLPSAVLAVLAAVAVAYLLALYLGRGVRAILLGALGRGHAPESWTAAVGTPVRVVRRVAFAFLSVVLAFPALELAGHRTPVGPS